MLSPIFRAVFFSSYQSTFLSLRDAPGRLALYIGVSFVQAALMADSDSSPTVDGHSSPTVQVDGDSTTGSAPALPVLVRARGGAKSDTACVPRSLNSKVHPAVISSLNGIRSTWSGSEEHGKLANWNDVLGFGLQVRYYNVCFFIQICKTQP